MVETCWNPINNGINHLSAGAGFRNHFLPSTSAMQAGNHGLQVKAIQWLHLAWRDAAQNELSAKIGWFSPKNIHRVFLLLMYSKTIGFKMTHKLDDFGVFLHFKNPNHKVYLHIYLTRKSDSAVLLVTHAAFCPMHKGCSDSSNCPTVALKASATWLQLSTLWTAPICMCANQRCCCFKCFCCWQPSSLNKWF